MTRSLDDFSDDPDPIEAEAQAFVVRCRELAEDEPTAYAADTLHGIAETVAQLGRVTPGQRQAVENIVAGADRRERGSRRYEGWRRNGWPRQ
jgi:hypothetical protein